jgi:hypothetical protein
MTGSQFNGNYSDEFEKSERFRADTLSIWGLGLLEMDRVYCRISTILRRLY